MAIVDRRVPWLGAKAIGDRAQFARELHHEKNTARLNVRRMVEHFSRFDIPGRGKLAIKVRELEGNRYPAYMSFNPPTMHVDSEVRELAGDGSVRENFILAHELGHFLLHDASMLENHRQNVGFSDASDKYSPVPNEHSAESQATTFAERLLLPDHIVRAFSTEQQLVLGTGVARGLAAKRLAEVGGRTLPLRTYDPNCCENCGGFHVGRKGTVFSCEDCNAQYEK